MWYNFAAGYWILGAVSRSRKTSILVCQGSYNKVLQTGWLKEKKIISHGSGGWKFKIKV